MLTLNNKTHPWIFTLNFLVIPSKNKNLIFVQRCPSTATQQSKLSLMLNSRIDFWPQICLNTINFKCIVIFSIRVNTTKFDKIFLANRAKTRICCLIFTRCNWFDFWCSRNKQLAFFQSLVVIGHSTTYID